ncbi:hypothetical protein HPB50_028462 [Hyalomma asiaticum]|nr:hypothetical protein HPB50_028462 [Hyalomma asiaticum]
MRPESLPPSAARQRQPAAMKQIIGNIRCGDTLSIASHCPSKVTEEETFLPPCDMADLIGMPPGFWNHPGTPTVPWTRWLEDFETYGLAAGGESFSAKRKVALLKTLLGAEGQRQARVALAAASETPGSTKDASSVLVQTLTAKFSPPDAVATVVSEPRARRVFPPGFSLRIARHS